MALRGLAQAALSSSSSWARCMSSASTPSVFDKMVQVFVIDKSGVRHTVRGLEGQSLAATLCEYGQFPSDAFMPHPYDPAHPDCHLYVQGDYLQRLGPLTPEQQQEQQRLLEYHVRSKARDNSRLGYFIKLGPTLNGATFALGDLEPWETQ